MLPRAIFFDLDNTLVHRGLSIASYARQFVHDFGSQLHKPDAGRVSEVILRWDSGGYLPADSIYPSIKAAVTFGLLNELAWRVAASQLHLLVHWEEYFPACSIEMPGATDVMGELSERGFVLGVIPNGMQRSRARTLGNLAFKHHISLLVSSERMGVRKPNPRIFTAAASEMGVEPRECWYIGDHPINDCVGANAAGMKSVWLRGFHEWPGGQERSSMELLSLSELPNLLHERS